MCTFLCTLATLLNSTRAAAAAAPATTALSSEEKALVRLPDGKE